MKLSISKSLLIGSINNLSKVLKPSKSAVAAGVLLQAENDNLTITAHGDEIAIKEVIQVDAESKLTLAIEKEGSIILNAKFLAEVLKSLSQEVVTLEVKDNYQVKVSAGKSKMLLDGINGSEYPQFKLIDGEADFILTGKQIHEIVKEMEYAVATTDVRPTLTGINFQTVDDKVQLVATDSHRLVRKFMDIKTKEPISCTIPIGALTNLKRIVKEDEETKVTVSQSSITIISPTVTLHSLLLEGNYPDVRRLIPSEFACETTVGRNEFLDTLNRAILFVTNKTVKCSINKSFSIQVADTFSEEIEDAMVNGEEMDIHLGAKFLKDLLQAIGDEVVEFKMVAPLKPVIFKGKESTDTIHLLVPVRTS